MMAHKWPEIIEHMNPKEGVKAAMRIRVHEGKEHVRALQATLVVETAIVTDDEEGRGGSSLSTEKVPLDSSGNLLNTAMMMTTTERNRAWNVPDETKHSKSVRP